MVLMVLEVILVVLGVVLVVLGMVLVVLHGAQRQCSEQMFGTDVRNRRCSEQCSEPTQHGEPMESQARSFSGTQYLTANRAEGCAGIIMIGQYKAMIRL